MVGCVWELPSNGVGQVANCLTNPSGQVTGGFQLTGLLTGERTVGFDELAHQSLAYHLPLSDYHTIFPNKTAKVQSP